MPEPSNTVLICSCEDTMRLDTGAIRRGCRKSEIGEFRQLCRAELDDFRNAAKTEGPLIVGCTQEASLFGEEANGRPGRTEFVNLRETAGWSTEGAKAGPKMAALLAAASEPAPAFPFVTLSSEGVILILGRDEAAIEAGRLLADRRRLCGAPSLLAQRARLRSPAQRPDLALRRRARSLRRDAAVSGA